MTNLLVLIPIALGLGLTALAGFLWAYRSGQFDDLEGDGLRVLSDGEHAPPLQAGMRGQAHASPASVLVVSQSFDERPWDGLSKSAQSVRSPASASLGP